MRRGHLNAEAPLGSLGETHSVGRRMSFINLRRIRYSNAPTAVANTPSPNIDFNQHMGANPYRQDRRPTQQFFDLDLDLNPDL